MNTENLIRDMKARFNHNSSKEQLKEKYRSKLTFADQGGLWTVNATLLSILTSSSATSIVLLDDYENPVKVDRHLLLNRASKLYLEVMEQWHTEFSELQNKR